MLLLSGSFGVGIEVADQTCNVRIVSVWFKAKTMLGCNGKGQNQVHDGDLSEQVLLGVTFTLADMDPRVTSQIAGMDEERAPCFATFRVAFVGS